MEQQREAICAALRQHTGLTSIVWRPAADMLKEEGCEPAQQPGAEAAEAAAEGADEGAAVEAAEAAAAASSSTSSSSIGAAPATVVVMENGLKFLASPLGQKVRCCAGDHGKRLCSVRFASALLAHVLLPVAESCATCNVCLLSCERSLSAHTHPKCLLSLPCHTLPFLSQTGFYADQRDSRAVVRQLAAGRSVLDMCCFSGGFALSAAAGGATAALGVDSSAAAVELAGRNAELNGLQGVASFVRADVADFMKQVGMGLQVAGLADGCVGILPGFMLQNLQSSSMQYANSAARKHACTAATTA